MAASGCFEKAAWKRPVESDDAVGACIVQIFGNKARPCMCLPGIDHQHVEICPGQGNFDSGENFRKERISEIGNKHDNGAGALTPQIARCLIDPVTGLFGRCQHGITCCFGDSFRLGERAAHRCGGNARYPGNIGYLRCTHVCFIPRGRGRKTFLRLRREYALTLFTIPVNLHVIDCSNPVGGGGIDCAGWEAG